MLNNLFKGIFDSASVTVISAADFLLCVGVALLIGGLIALTASRKTGYTNSFLVSLFALPALSCVVIMMVNGNVGAGVATAGAFSLVRFRSAPGTAKEIALIFMAMVAGLVAGMGYLAYAALFALILCVIFLLLGRFDPEAKGLTKTLRITIPEDLDYDGVFDGLPELPAPTEEQRLEAYREFEAMVNASGLVGFHEGGSDEGKIRMLQNYGTTGDMHLRISMPIRLSSEPIDADLAGKTIAILDGLQSTNNDFLRANSTKIIIDGVPEGKSAYMLEPYAETAGVDPDYRSEPYWTDQDVMNDFVKQVNEAGYSVIVHTMGDGGARMDTIAFQHSYDALGETWATKRNGIVHATIMAPEDIEACGKMGIFNATQCVWFYVDPQFGALELQMFGPERFGREYNMRTRLDAGMFMTSGADYPITPDFRPLFGIQCAVTQGSPYPGEGDDPSFVRNADEGVTIEEAMKCYTIWCARQMGMEDILGSIEVGKKADFVVLDQDLTKIDPTTISATNVVYTIFGGKVVYEG